MTSIEEDPLLISFYIPVFSHVCMQVMVYSSVHTIKAQEQQIQCTHWGQQWLAAVAVLLSLRKWTRRNSFCPQDATLARSCCALMSTTDVSEVEHLFFSSHISFHSYFWVILPPFFLFYKDTEHPFEARLNSNRCFVAVHDMTTLSASNFKLLSIFIFVPFVRWCDDCKKMTLIRCGHC